MKDEGLSEEEARRHFWIIDSKGLLHTRRTGLSAEQQVYAQPDERIEGWAKTADGSIGLAEVIQNIEATILVGLSTRGGAFTEAMVREMAGKVARPMILPLSNPTTKSEAAPADLLRWTNGRALIATGSPYAPVRIRGAADSHLAMQQRVHFPRGGAGSGVRGGAARDRQHAAGGGAGAGAHSPARTEPGGPLLPAWNDIRKMAAEIAMAVGVEAQRSGVAPKTSEEELRARVTANQWIPEYQDLPQAGT